jgi:hypothetical protein
VSAFNDAIQFFESTFSDPITINLDVGYGEVDGLTLGSNAAGQSLTYLDGPLTYSQVTSTLAADATSANDDTAVASLGATDPTNGGNFVVSTAQAKALGLLGASTAIDGYVGFSSSLNFAYDPNSRAVAGEYDFIGIAEHEVSEVMGRIALLGETLGSGTGAIQDSYSIQDLFRYSAKGTRQLVGGKAAYFSVDGGATKLLSFNSIAGEDYGDWAGSTIDAANANASKDALLPFSTTDITEMDVLGYTVACFAEGTRIETPNGPIAVEALRPGALVLTAAGASRVVRWFGHRRIDLRRHPDPAAALPVRILAHAFAQRQPRRDLLLSPDHALLIDGMLIPARLLMNSMTIWQERNWRTVSYFHVELDTHDVLLAEGLPAESYLDTGNRGMFENADLPLTLHPFAGAENDQARREAESCAPLVVDAERVVRIWQKLAERAQALGYTAPVVATTTDPALHLEVDGRNLAPVMVREGRAVFVLPTIIEAVRLVSRATTPNMLRPWVDDRRLLGIAVRRLRLRHNDAVTDIPLDHPRLHDGWWALEQDGCQHARWTNGHATLPLALEGPSTLEIEFGTLPAYVLDEVSRHELNGHLSRPARC